MKRVIKKVNQTKGKEIDIDFFCRKCLKSYIGEAVRCEYDPKFLFGVCENCGSMSEGSIIDPEYMEMTPCERMLFYENRGYSTRQC